MLIQPFLNYNLPKGWYLTSSPIITADWNSKTTRADRSRWPRCGSRVRVRNTAHQAFLGAYNAVKPEVLGQTLIGDWTFRAQVQFLFPTGG